MPARPTCYVIAGPNGAGKTTFAMEFLPHVVQCRNFINADMIAQGIAPLNVEAAAPEAGRLFLRQIRSQIAARKDFAFETTLAGRTYVGWFKAMRRAGYEIRIYFLWLPTMKLALARVAKRVKRGGHNVPAAVVRRRFARGLANLLQRYGPLADYLAAFDNSSAAPVLVYERDAVAERVSRPLIWAKIKEQAGG